MESIRKIRVLQRQSQWEVAKQTGIPQSRISLIENSLVRPKFEELEKLAKYLEVNVDDFL